MRNKKKLAGLAALTAAAILITIGIAYKSQRVDAFNPQPDPPGFGMIGITLGQTLRVTVVNTNPAPNAEIPPDPVRVTVNFRDGSNNLFRNADGTPVRRIVQLDGGESTTLDLNGNNFSRSLDSAGRIQLCPVVAIQQPDGTGNIPPDPVIPTVEVFNNNNGRTQFVMPALLPAVQHAARPTEN